ncbi:bacteriohopanetetrol glucosamine biosynthesis glycosyltransferase HpnI [Commensalibacter papalotli (ex Botero et al. 2024)]|uniref:Catalytic subunit of cellulose synthase and poly-beta-1 n=1 Tax=Commensalibacter papalotli (ex Botero et al. 2024) TaxID=2972766 RepID=A0ABM9HT82_9PROT|nr:bacteriohopanetetrol glucosamine biosynthesis glycosyltransferase HpnI [Commensalibacter papalotli (ex Botero et al. 2024)]CAI3954199.1 6-N-acetylglucosamine synthase (BcsA) (PDB:4HG6) [Commensalibacter papalotli (ex Botero et al. 2024)]CAI3954720.1 6-N-acetylglucosamine synthase (BcsA) (PDB:4HG6) [Commensalibacter papalotli (ex Botero et al. 2024)]
MSCSLFKLSKSNKLLLSCAALGCIQAAIGSLLVQFFQKNKKIESYSTNTLPKVTVFKPLSGKEPLLFEALQSFCEQNYPNLQIIFGLHHSKDPALTIVKNLQKLYPNVEINIVVNPDIHGHNRKVSNLINMFPAAKHEIFIISDSDIHAPNKNYLKEMVLELQKPNIGLVTSLYSGLPSFESRVQHIASAHINYNFMPGVLLSRYLGRQDCLGAAIAIKRDLLEKIGGFTSLVNYVADDAVLGRKIKAQYLDIALAPDIVQTTVTEKDLFSLYEHELRWNRTTFILEPIGFTLSFLQLPLFWASLAVIFNPLTWISWICFLLCWGVKALCCLLINKKLNYPSLRIISLLPYRDWFSALVMFNSFFGTKVTWRGQKMTIKKHPEFQTTLYSDI